MRILNCVLSVAVGTAALVSCSSRTQQHAKETTSSAANDAKQDFQKGKEEAGEATENAGDAAERAGDKARDATQQKPDQR